MSTVQVNTEVLRRERKIVRESTPATEYRAAEMKRISENIIECWTRIKAKARMEGHLTNIERYAPCITGALNQMEQFLTGGVKHPPVINDE